MYSVGYHTSVNPDVGYHVLLLFLCAVLRSQDESANSIEDHQKQKKVPPPGLGRSENPRFPEEEGVCVCVCVCGWVGGCEVFVCFYACVCVPVNVYWIAMFVSRTVRTNTTSFT